MNTPLPPPGNPPSIGVDEYRSRLAVQSPTLQDQEKDALGRLMAIASGDTGQSRRVADFLLAWWNAGECGGFDLTTLWGVDAVIANDMTTVFGLIARVNSYPDSLGYEREFKAIVRAWRPELG